EAAPSAGEVSAEQAMRAGRMMLQPVAEAGGLGRVSAEHAEISAHHGHNYLPLIARFYRSHRAALRKIVAALDLASTSADPARLEARAFYLANHDRTGETTDDRPPGAEAPLGLGFASGAWQKTVRDRSRPGTLVRRHFEVCVLTYLAEGLRTGDVAVAGSQDY